MILHTRKRGCGCDTTLLNRMGPYLGHGTKIWYILDWLPIPNNMLNMFVQYQMQYHRLAVSFLGRILFMAALWTFRSESCVWLCLGFKSRILVTVPNAFSDSSFINPVCAHAVFEWSTDNEWRNPSGTSSDFFWRLEQSYLGVGQSKKEKPLLTINNHLWFNVQTVYSRTREREWERERKRERYIYRERKSVRLYEQTQGNTCSLPARQNSLNANF